MDTPIKTMLTVLGIGGRFDVEGENLKMLLPPDCPSAIKDGIRRNKPSLIKLLHLCFLVIRSESLQRILFLTPDERTKEMLVAAGAEPQDVYTKSEIKELLRLGVTADELPLFHEARKQFKGRLIEL